MDSFEKNTSLSENILQEHQPDYEKAEMDLLRDALKRTYKKRLLFANTLYKIQQVFNKAIITHHPYTLDK